METDINNAQSGTPLSFLFRVMFLVASVAAVFLSLMTFPAGIPWMVGLWVFFALIQYQRGKSVWIPLAICGAILLIKRPGFTLEFAVMEVALLCVVLISIFERRESSEQKRPHLLLYSVILAAAVLYFGAARNESATASQHLPADERPVICLGDSLTAYGYPEELTKRISLPVRNFGIDGITTEDGIKMLPEMLAANPQAVVLELGGHDCKDGKPRTATRKNLVSLIEAFRDQGATVILVEIPHGFIFDPYDALERELASKYDLQLVSDSVIRSFILNSPIMPPGIWMSEDSHLSNDGLHPNRLGNQHFANVVSRALSQVFGKEILVEQ